jgi:hypothetical protein
MVSPTPDPGAVPPGRPQGWQERFGSWLFYLVAPRLGRAPSPPPPDRLAPATRIAIPRRGRGGSLDGTFFPAPGARAAALLVHPWTDWGQAYFHRRGRIEALRAAGIHALTFDQSGFHGSAARRGFPDADVADALACLGELAPGLPRVLWGVSSGGYWSHFVLARQPLCRAAAFEDVAPHLLRWAWREAPAGRPFYAFFRLLLPSVWRWLDLRGHAPHLRLHAASYTSGVRDRGVRPDETAELARRARARCLLVPRAGHLMAIKLAGEEVVQAALTVFGA